MLEGTSDYCCENAVPPRPMRDYAWGVFFRRPIYHCAFCGLRICKLEYTKGKCWEEFQPVSYLDRIRVYCMPCLKIQKEGDRREILRQSRAVIFQQIGTSKKGLETLLNKND